MAGIFKAYDIRGVVPDELDEATAVAVGRAFHRVLLADGAEGVGPVVVGRDMRPHSPRLAAALTEGLRTAGRDVIDVGLATTPMSYFAVATLEAAGGVQVTASHNPAQYNGFKLSRRGARPVSSADGIAAIERLVSSGELPTAARPGERTERDLRQAYQQRILGALRRPPGARRLRVVADAANGMGALYRPVLEAAGIDLVPLYFELDGTFPNHEANPLKVENLEDLCSEVRRVGADLGIGFDGDADRAAFVDERGEPVGSDLTTALLAGEILERHPGSAVVYDLRSSHAVAEYIREHGGVPVRERVGHSFIKATLRQRDGVFGGELAGHYYFRDAFYADSAILAVIEMLNLLWRHQRPLSGLVAPLVRYAKSPETNFQVADKDGMLRTLAERFADGEVDHLDGVTVQFPDWWFNARPSNTEPFLRLVVEARTAEDLQRHLDALIEILGEPV